MKVQITIITGKEIEVFHTEIDESLSNYVAKKERQIDNKESFKIFCDDRYVIIGNEILQNSIIEFKQIKD